MVTPSPKLLLVVLASEYEPNEEHEEDGEDSAEDGSASGCFRVELVGIASKSFLF